MMMMMTVNMKCMMMTNIVDNLQEQKQTTTDLRIDLLSSRRKRDVVYSGRNVVFSGMSLLLVLVAIVTTLPLAISAFVTGPVTRSTRTHHRINNSLPPPPPPPPAMMITKLSMGLIAFDSVGGDPKKKDGGDDSPFLTSPSSSSVPFKSSSSPFSTSRKNDSNNDDDNDEGTKKIPRDKNGNPIAVGDIVSVAKSGLKAYQVGKKGFGSFDETTKEFIPATDEEMSVRSGKALCLPTGLEGEVTNIIDKSDGLSANFPVVVKFVHQPDDDDDDDNGNGGKKIPFNPPVTFSMHLEPKEIQVVV